MIKSGILEYGLFDKNLYEVDCDGIRYIFRRNPVRSEEIDAVRVSKLEKVKELVQKQNVRLSEHPKAQVKTSLERVEEKIKQLKLEQWVRVPSPEEGIRNLELQIDEKVLEELKRLDGCYVLKTDVPQEMSTKEEIHKRYKDLALVESAFSLSSRKL